MFKKKQFYFDVIVNMMAFGIYIGAFHLVMMPYLANVLPVATNARLLTYIMFNNILSLSLGNELGILYLILEGRRPGLHNLQDIRRLLKLTNAGVAVGMLILLALLGFSPLEVVVLSLVTVMTNQRLYLQNFLKQQKNFKAIGVGNLFYLIGVVAAIILLNVYSVIFWLPLLLSEVLSLASLYPLTRDSRAVPAGKSPYHKDAAKEYRELIWATLLTNIPNYTDKLLVLPLLGSVAMSAYYAGTVLSKMLFLLVNPVNSVLLAWLSSDRETKDKDVIRIQLRVNLLILGLLILTGIPMTYIMVRILYQQFLPQVASILFPLALISAFAIASSLLRVVFLRYYDLKYLKFINMLQIIVFLILPPLGATWLGLSGFAYGMAVSKVVLWASFFLMLLKGGHYRTSGVVEETADNREIMEG